MKKIVLLALLILIPSLAFAEVESLIKTVTIDNNSAQDLTTYIPTTTIVPGIDKVVDINVYPFKASLFGVYASAWDSTAATAGSITIQDNFAEIEGLANTWAEKFFMYPKKLKNGLRITQGPYTTVHVEYTR
jgi:hypothetical protein